MGYQKCLVKNIPVFHVLCCIPTIQDGELWLCGSECGIFDSSPFFIVGRVSQPGRVNNRHHCALLPTSQDSSFHVLIFLVSGEKEGRKLRKTPNSVLLFSLYREYNLQLQNKDDLCAQTT